MGRAVKSLQTKRQETDADIFEAIAARGDSKDAKVSSAQGGPGKYAQNPPCSARRCSRWAGRGSQLTRWQINIMLEEAETYNAQGNRDESATVALDALKLVNTLRLDGKKERIRRLYQNLYARDANYPLVRLLGQELGME